MALVLADRVKETTTTTGTGTITLAGAVTGFQSFAVVGNTNTTYYTIAGQTGSEWEVGIGTYTSSGTTLSRDTVLASSNAGSLVNFSAGTKDVFVTYPAGRSIFANGTTLQTTNNAILPVASGGSGTATPSIVAGTNVTVTGTWPNQTINSGGSPFTSPVEINVNSTSSALTINQIGTGNALLVEDSASPDSTPTVIDQFGNVLLGKTSRQVAVSNKIEVHSTSNELSGLAPSVGLYNWNATSSIASYVTFGHYPSGTVGTTTTANSSGDLLGGIRFFTQNGAGLAYSGTITATTASDLISVNLAYSAGSHSFTGPITSGTWNGTAIGIAYGGTGQTTRQNAMDALAGAVTSGQYLRGNGTDVVMSAIQAGDVPTLNQNTTGTSANVTGTVAIANGGTGASTLAGASIATYTGTETLTNKRIDPRTITTTSTATLTPDISVDDQFNITAQAVGLTVAAPTGTPVDGNKIIFRILDNGTAQTISWNATYTVIGVTLPTTTVVNKTTYVGCIYNANNTRWDVIAVVTQV
jgi:hypothetical protein